MLITSSLKHLAKLCSHAEKFTSFLLGCGSIVLCKSRSVYLEDEGVCQGKNGFAVLFAIELFVFCRARKEDESHTLVYYSEALYVLERYVFSLGCDADKSQRLGGEEYFSVFGDGGSLQLHLNAANKRSFYVYFQTKRGSKDFVCHFVSPESKIF